MENLIIFGAKYLIIFSALIFLAYFFKQSSQRRREIAIFSLIALPVIYIVAKISSLIYFDPRPFITENIVPLLPHAADNGFPSDHTLLASAVAMIIFYYNKKVGTLLLLLAFFVGFSRVLAGVHHFADIAGSFVVSVAISFFVYKFILPKLLGSGFYQKFAKLLF